MTSTVLRVLKQDLVKVDRIEKGLTLKTQANGTQIHRRLTPRKIAFIRRWFNAFFNTHRLQYILKKYMKYYYIYCRV